MTYESKTTMPVREQLRQWFDSLTGLTAYDVVGVLDDLAAAETEIERLREACIAPEHDSTDFNCPDDPYTQEGCQACAGRVLREQVKGVAREPGE